MTVEVFPSSFFFVNFEIIPFDGFWVFGQFPCCQFNCATRLRSNKIILRFFPGVHFYLPALFSVLEVNQMKSLSWFSQAVYIQVAVGNPQGVEEDCSMAICGLLLYCCWLLCLSSLWVTLSQKATKWWRRAGVKCLRQWQPSWNSWQGIPYMSMQTKEDFGAEMQVKPNRAEQILGCSLIQVYSSDGRIERK